VLTTIAAQEREFSHFQKPSSFGAPPWLGYSVALGDSNAQPLSKA